MAWTLDDRYVWLGLGALFFIAAKGISRGLRQTLELTEYDEPADNATVNRENCAEDSIGLESLQKLATSSNHDIANAAVSLIVSRFALSDAACNALTLDLFSQSQETRDRTKQVMDLLDAYPLPAEFPKPDVLRTEPVRALQSSTSDKRTKIMCMQFFKTMNHLTHGLASHRDVAEAVDAALRYEPSSGRIYEPMFNNRDDGLYRHVDLSVESLDRLLARAGSTSSQPVRVHTAALSALLHSQNSRTHGTSLGSDTRVLEESPEEAEMRRRRNRAVRVMETEDHIML